MYARALEFVSYSSHGMSKVEMSEMQPAPAATVTKAIKAGIEGLSKSAAGFVLKSGHTEL